MSEKNNGNRTYFDDTTVVWGTIATVVMLAALAYIVIYG